MEYLLKDIKHDIENHYLQVGHYHYDSNLFEQTLTTDTLYLIKEFLDDKFKAKKISAIYPHQFKIVTPEEWKDVFINKKEGVILLDEAKSLYPNHVTQYTLRKASTGELLFYSTYSWLNNNDMPYYTLEESFFQKMLSYYIY